MDLTYTGRGIRVTDEMREAAAEEVHVRLSDEAEAAVLLPPQRRELSGHSGEMVLNGAYLVHRSRVEAFKAAVEATKTANNAR